MANTLYTKLVETVYNVKKYGALGNGTTDDTVAIQTAINAAHNAGGGTIYFPNGIYIINGALVTSLNSMNPNCQLYIPLSDYGSAMTRLKFLGEAPPNWASEVISGSVRNTKGVILKSTIIGTGTYPAVFGTPTGAGGTFNMTYVDFENMVVFTRTKTGSTHIAPTMSGFTFNNIVACTFKNVAIQAESPSSDLVIPTGTVGVWFPHSANKAVCRFEISKVEGFDRGLVISEHFVGDGCIVTGCINGIWTETGDHSSIIYDLRIEGNRNNIVTGGFVQLLIMNYDTEHYFGPEFYSFEKDLTGGGSNLIKIFRTWVVESNVGAVNDFIVDAGMAYKVFIGPGAN